MKEKTKNFIEEFKAFALKGNVMDMAIGVIIGGAFQTIVASLTTDLITPLIGILFKADLQYLAWDVFGDGKLIFTYGNFIAAIINFLILALVLFCMLKFVHRLMELGKKPEEPAPAEPEAPPAPTQEELLAEILAVLKAQAAEEKK